MTYIVEGTIADTSISYVESKPVMAVIPGYKYTQRLELTMAGTPFSEFIYSADGPEKDVNHYINEFAIATLASSRYPLLVRHLQPGAKFVLNRADAISGIWEKRGEITVTRSATSGGALLIYGKGENGAERVLFTADAAAGADARVTPVEYSDGRKVVWFTDDFSANTFGNAHPDAYAYRLTTNIPVENDGGTVEGYAESAVVTIRIPKSEVDVRFDHTYSKSEIESDFRDLKPSTRIVEYRVDDVAGLANYSVKVDNKIQISNATRSQDGTYMRSDYESRPTDEIDSDGFPIMKNGWSDPAKISDFTSPQQFTLCNAEGASFGDAVVVITDAMGNTYGTGRCQIGATPVLTAAISYIGKSAASSSAGTHNYTIRASATLDMDGPGLTDSGLYNIWFTYNERPQDINVLSDYWWKSHPFKTQVVNPTTSNGGGAYVINDDFCPGWEVDEVRPLIVSMLARSYPQIATTARDASEPRYVVLERVTFGSHKTHGNITGVDGVDTDNSATVAVEVYNLNGVRVHTATAPAGTQPQTLIPESLPAGVYMVRIGAKVHKVVTK